METRVVCAAAVWCPPFSPAPPGDVRVSDRPCVGRPSHEMITEPEQTSSPATSEPAAHERSPLGYGTRCLTAMTHGYVPACLFPLVLPSFYRILLVLLKNFAAKRQRLPRLSIGPLSLALNLISCRLIHFVPPKWTAFVKPPALCGHVPSLPIHLSSLPDSPRKLPEEAKDDRRHDSKLVSAVGESRTHVGV